jgi:hypothetical protein
MSNFMNRGFISVFACIALASCGKSSAPKGIENEPAPEVKSSDVGMENFKQKMKEGEKIIDKVDAGFSGFSGGSKTFSMLAPAAEVPAAEAPASEPNNPSNNVSRIDKSFGRLAQSANCDEILSSLQTVYSDAGKHVKKTLQNLQNVPNGTTGARSTDSDFTVSYDQDGPFLDSKVTGSYQDYVIDLAVREKGLFMTGEKDAAPDDAALVTSSGFNIDIDMKAKADLNKEEVAMTLGIDEDFHFGGGASNVRVNYETNIKGGLQPTVEEKISLMLPYGTGDGQNQKSEYYVKAQRESDTVIMLQFKKKVDIAGRIESSNETLRLRRVLDQCFVVRGDRPPEEPRG